MNRTSLLALTSITFVALLAGRPAMAQQPRFRVAELDLPPLGFTPSLDETPDYHGTIAINNYGEIVYARMVNDEMHAWVYLPEGAFGQAAGFLDLNDLDNLPATDAAAWDINMSGQIVGQFDGSVLGQGQAVVWQLGQSVKACPPGFLTCEPPDLWSVAYAINDASPPVVVGAGKFSGAYPDLDCSHWKDRAFEAEFNFIVACPTPTLQILSPLLGSNDRAAYAFDVNATKVVGYSLREAYGSPCGNPVCNDDQDALTWPPGIDYLPLHTLPLPAGGHEVRGINDSGQLVGRGYDHNYDPPCLSRALFWEDDEPTTEPVNLGSEDYGIPPAQETRALAINNRVPLQVVGANMETGRAFLWEQDGDWQPAINLQDMIDPNSGWELIEAHDINDGGCIVGWGLFQEPGRQATVNAFLLYDNCPCDCDGSNDAIVSVGDFLALLAQWGTPGPCDCEDPPDGVVDVGDFLAMLASWGPCCRQGGFAPPQTVQDCINRFGFDPLLLEKCICAVEPDQCPE